MSGKTLRISRDLALPLEAVTESIAILAKRRVGKSYTGRVFVEKLFGAGQQFVVVDPKGDWWGIRSSADGKSPGLPIVIVGGEHSDIPLEVGGGELVARLLVEQRVSMLIDLSALRKGEVKTFMAAFLETLYRLKARDQFRTPLMVVVDEADAIAPQRPDDGEQRMLGAIEDLVRRGGQRGIGVMLISQRAAVLNKNVLTQCGILILLRTMGSQDIEAVDTWIKKHGQPAERAVVMQEIASLPIGTAWVWAPGWPDDAGIFQRVEIAPIATFDSGKTPKPGEVQRAPKTLADVNLDVFRAEMAATIERAKADDPKALKAQVAQLTRERDAARKTAPAPVVPPILEAERIEVPVVLDNSIAGLGQLLTRVEALRDRMSNPITTIAEALRLMIEEARAINAKALGEMARPLAPVRRAPITASPTSARPVATRPTTPAALPLDRLPPAQQRILDSLAWWESARIDAPTREQTAFVAQYTVNGHFRNMLGGLCTAGLITYPVPGAVQLTEAGRSVAHGPPDAPTRAELIRRVDDVLGTESFQRIFAAAVEAAPGSLTRDELASRSGYTVNGHFRNMLGRLSTLGVIVYPAPGMVSLAPLFEALP